MITVNITEAKARFSELVAAAERGEGVRICRAGHPVVDILPAAVSAEDRFVPRLHLGPIQVLSDPIAPLLPSQSPDETAAAITAPAP